MMDTEDPRVKSLQELAWSLQKVSSKPGGRCPEDYKRECYKLASRATALCSDVAYTEEADFVERSAVLTKLLEAKKVEVGEVEEREKQKVTGKCYRAAPGGNYTVGDIASKASRASAGYEAGRALSSTAGGARALTAGEVAARLEDDPEALFLCDLGLGDSDVETLCQGLQRAGANLTSLDVSHNHVADVGVQKLVSALATGACPKLKELHIGFNSFGDLGTQMLTGGLAALRRNLVVHLDADGQQGVVSEPAAPAASSASVESTVEAAACADLERPTPQQEVAQELAPPPRETEARDSPSGRTESPGAAVDVKERPAAPETSAPVERPAVAPAPRAAPPGGDAVSVDLVKASSGEGVEVRVVLSLPEGINSASDLDVDVSTRRIVARNISGVQIADAALPCAVITDTAQAVFSRKRRTMTLKLSPVDPVAAAAVHGA